VRTDAIYRIVERKAQEHPELVPLSWDGLCRILAREGIELFRLPLPRPAQLVQYCGTWSILVNANLPRRTHTVFAAHELGHLWLHHDPTCERWERCYNMDEDWLRSPREDDAQLFAMIVSGRIDITRNDVARWQDRIADLGGA
jgi:hypothetical protein